MLLELHIKNFALIEDLNLRAGPGFNVLTGETGAGKSIIVDAVAAVLGERVGTEVVRHGETTCRIDTVFDLSDAPEAARTVQEAGYGPDEQLLIISREIGETRSSFRVNGRPATAALIKDISYRLVDIHGQHEHQSLLDVETHLDILDEFCGEGASALREKTRETFLQLQNARTRQANLVRDSRERARLVDLYAFQLEEIDSAKLSPDEESDLAAEKNLLANVEKLKDFAAQIYESLAAESAAIDALSSAYQQAQRMSDTDPQTQSVAESLQSSLSCAEDAAAHARRYRDSLDADPARLEAIQERLELIRALKKKYGDSIEEILSYRDTTAERLRRLRDAQETSEGLEEFIERLGAELTAMAGKLSERRESAKAPFEKAVEQQLEELAMGGSRFVAAIEPVEPGPDGCDRVEFLISANPGEPPKPLAKIASGGEVSRIMLAIKSVTTAPGVPTMVFDEVDVGIGGITAHALGQKMAALSAHGQTLCVTHLPQIAGKASTHFAVRKVAKNGRSVVVVDELKGEERVAEIARMLGATGGSSAAVEHARELLTAAPDHSG